MALAPETFAPSGGSAGPNYTLGRGKLYFARQGDDPNEIVKVYRFLSLIHI